MVKLTIDNKPVEIHEGATILEAALKAGVSIPTLCYNEELSPAGACRVCVVELAQTPYSITVTACTHPVADGMVVSTRSEKAVKARKMAVEMLTGAAPALGKDSQTGANTRNQRTALFRQD